MTPRGPYPPSAQRIAEARAHGHVPQSPLAGVAAGVVALIVGASALGPSLWMHLLTLYRTSLLAFAAGRPGDAYRAVEASLGGIMRGLFGFLAGAAILVAATLTLMQGCSLGAPWRASKRFARLAPSRTASVLFVLGLALVGGTAIADALIGPEPARALFDAAMGIAVLALACGAIDAAFARARFAASLWLTRGEHLEEQRSAFGSPEARRAREAARRALWGSS